MVAGALIPVLGAIQLLSQQGKLADGAAWLLVFGIFISTTTAVIISFLTELNAEVGNPPIVTPPGAPDVPTQ